MNKISKIIWSLFSSIVCLSHHSNADAYNMPSICVTYYGSACNYPLPGNVWVDSNEHCKDMALDWKCHHSTAGNFFAIKNCRACDPGYTLTETGNVSDSACTQAGIDTYHSYECRCVCSNCTSNTSWTAYGTGYEKHTGKGCVCSSGTPTCTTTTMYRCAKGWYGTTNNGTSGCTQCPGGGTTLAADSTSISYCYIPEGEYTDTTGKYAMNCDCPYNGKDKCYSSSSSSAA